MAPAPPAHPISGESVIWDFNSLISGIRTSRVSLALTLFLSLFITFKSIHRLCFSSLSKFPGPRFAAATKLYEAYHVLVKNDWLENLHALHKEFGPVVRIGPNELHFADNEFSLQLHKRSDLYKCDNYYGLLGKLLGGLASPQQHSYRKSQMQPLFTGKTLARYSSTTMNSYLDQLHDRFAELSTEVQVNATHFLWAFTNDVMVSYITGKDHGYLKRPDMQVMHDATRAFSAIDLATVLRAMPPVKKMFDVIPQLRRRSPLGLLDELVGTQLKPVMKQHLTETDSEDQSVLARLWHRIGDRQTVTQECAQAMFIGNESLLSNMSFLLHFMINNPEYITRLRAELDTLDIVSYSYKVWRDPKVLQLGLLDALCKESTRLSSPSWHRQPRQSTSPVEFNGSIIPPKTSMSFTLHTLSRDPLLYMNPEQFNPDRWLGNSPGAKKARTSAVTFGTGTRTCLGQFISHHVLRKALACLIYNFDIAICDERAGGEGKFSYLATYPKKGQEGYMMVRLSPRFSSVT